MSTTAVHPGRALYSILRYWRSMGLQQLELPEIEEVEDLEAVLKERSSALTESQKALPLLDGFAWPKTRNPKVVSAGPLDPKLMFIASAPAEPEEAAGHPCAGPEGELLDKMLAKMEIGRGEVYLCHALPCRTPADRSPTWEELSAYRTWLHGEISLVRPKVIVALGTVATQTLLCRQIPITQVRGQWQEHGGVPVMPTYHPAYLLKKTSARKVVWTDMLAVLKALSTAVRS